MTTSRPPGIRRAAGVAGFLACVAALMPLPAAAAAERVLVMPFDNSNRDPRLYWVGEASSVVLADDLNALGGNAITRDERLGAFERLQVPVAASLSHATVIRIGQLVGAPLVVVGAISLDGTTLIVRARRIHLDAGRLDSEFVERGPLTDMFATFERLARRLYPSSAVPAEEVEKVHPPLAAFEQYMKGLLAETPATQVSYLETALKIAPSYDRATLALWELHTEQGDHQRALAAALEVPESSRLFRRARFCAAVSQIQSKLYEDAFLTLKRLLEGGSSAPIYNNLGVVQMRRGSTPQTGRSTYYFNRAAELDQDDPDYFFNLGYAYWNERDVQAAIYWLREAVRRDPADGDAHYVLGAALQAAGTMAEAQREKELARQLSSSYADWERRPSAAADPIPRGLERLRMQPELPRALRVDTALVASERQEQRELAAFHLDRARRLYEQERDSEAVTELRRSLYLSPYQAEAHLLLGRSYLRTGQVREAINAFKISLWSEETAAAHIALAGAFLQNKDETGARAEAERALELDPASSEAKRLIEKMR